MKRSRRTFSQNRLFTQNNPLSPRICPELASEIGLNESIMLLQYEFWIATEGEERDGHLWVRKTVREIKAVFSFWGTSTINRMIQKLTDSGYVVAGKYDEADAKNGRWLRFDFDVLATLKSIKVICANTGQTICAKNGVICTTLDDDLCHPASIPDSVLIIDQELEEKRTITPHSRLMTFLTLKLGVIAHPAKEGAQVKWLLENGYDPVQCEACYEHLVGQSWRTVEVTWTTVRAQIGNFVNGSNSKNSNGNGHSGSDYEFNPRSITR